jgi:hypothetical protein
MYAELETDVVLNNPAPLKGLAAWKGKMVTKEDPWHIHKTLGILCMLSFLFRLVQIGEFDMGFNSFPHLTLPTIVLHLLLNLTALNFKIPAKRIASGYRIWPQYRLHSLAFLSRSLLTMLIIYYEDLLQVDEPNYDLNLLLVLAGMVTADIASASTQAQYRSNTIRDLDAGRAVQFGFVLAQFYGTAVVLYGMRRYTIPMMSVIVIQGNAFLMTVRRKNLGSHNTLVAIYGAALMICAGVSVYEFRRESMSCLRIVATCGQLAFLMRTAPLPLAFQPLQNKYVVWSTVGLLLRYMRPRLHRYTWIQVYLFHFVTLLLVIWLFVRHCNVDKTRVAASSVAV